MQIEGNVLHLPLEDLALKKLENSLIEWAFQKSAGNKSQAARLLGITRDQLIYRLKTMSDGSAS
jgi:DNA-binding protein Fis